MNRVGNKLLAHVDKGPYEFEFHIVESKDVNAYALPGGKIVVCSELIRQVKQERIEAMRARLEEIKKDR